MLQARRTSPCQTPRAASAVAIAMVADTACISEKIGLSVLPSPYARFSTLALTAST